MKHKDNIRIRKVKLKAEKKAAAGSLDIMTNNSATLQNQPFQKAYIEIKDIYKLRDLAGIIMPFERVATCGKRLVSGRWVTVAKNTDKDIRFSNLRKCGSIWQCPTCAYKIQSLRQLQIFAFLADQQKDNQNEIYFLTLTIRHHKQQSLKEVLKGLQTTWLKLGKHRNHKQLFKGAKYISTLEVKKSLNNGWHPHYHIVFIGKKNTGLKNMIETYKENFAQLTKSTNINQVLLQCHNITDLSDYMAKWDMSQEIAMPNKKGGVSPLGGLTSWQLLSEYESTGDEYYKIAYREYCEAMKGAKQMNVSRTIKGLFKSDHELNEEKDTILEVIAGIDKQIWRKVVVEYCLYKTVLERAINGFQGVFEIIMQYAEIEIYQTNKIIFKYADNEPQTTKSIIITKGDSQGTMSPNEHFKKDSPKNQSGYFGESES